MRKGARNSTGEGQTKGPRETTKVLELQIFGQLRSDKFVRRHSLTIDWPRKGGHLKSKSRSKSPSEGIGEKIYDRGGSLR